MQIDVCEPHFVIGSVESRETRSYAKVVSYFKV